MFGVAASSPPPKPWEQAGAASGPTPFKPPSAGNTSDVVESSGTANPGEIVSSSDRTATVNRNAVGRPLPSRPWEQNYGSTSYGTTNNYGGKYGSLSGYNSSDIFLWRKISAFCYLLCIQYIFMNGLINGAFF